MTATPGPSSVIAEPLQPPGPEMFPAPYAQGVVSPWITDVLMTLPVALAVIGVDGRIIATNEALHATCGEACRPGVQPAMLFVEADMPQVAANIALLLGGEGPIRIRAALLARPDQQQMVMLTPVPPGLGIAGLLAMPDIREQVRLEKQVAAVTRMQAVGQLAGGIAHDFNNLLTAVLALTDQLLSRHPQGDADYDDLDQILVNARRAAALVEQLLAFARQQPRRQRVLDLESTVIALRPLLEQLIGQGVEMTIDAPGLARAVQADASQIEQIIVNLVVNARDAMAGAGRLHIALSDIGASDVAGLGHAIMSAVDYVAIAVTDTGTGISPAIAGRIFEPFFSTKPQGLGTGLGLSTVYGIVKQSGGFIFTQPGTERGTVFSIYLPAVPRHRIAAAETPALPPSLAAIAQIGRVLLVEDDAAVRLVLERGLKRQGVSVEAVDGGEAALVRLRDASAPTIDVIVSDVMMPGMDGVEMIARVRDFRPDVGIVLMSGFAEPPLHREADRQGVRFLAKPFATSELVAMIAAAANRS